MSENAVQEPITNELEAKRKQSIASVKAKLEVLEKLLEAYDKTYSLKIQTWKEKTNKLIVSQ
jgi:sensor domain CHASE-containing protein